ncbi:selenocysteine lyase/cysteine desulfurase [Actinomadura luteofluorescens]|uniref:Selenocysteine lyase/cysteine desulfurase n=1 Tax=Actinomadura luteofluorescens TaxID=46163 RepID=A0A7Y9JKG1_9ACTN|nr:aminotransferase class V-fold PLP-dependent enzyme [Actinomadura luteofluorescens]NYD52537.1 selenocysteine lyase/cysteine desulfurase [Actinomadura luteofluorescens]
MTQSVKPGERSVPDPAGTANGGSPRRLRDAPWESIRELFALDPTTTHLNTGTVGAMPYDVLDTMDRVTREWTGGLADVYKPSGYYEHRALIGRAFGVDQDEIVICHNATEGVARIIQGLDLHEGDEVVTTSHECYSVLSNFNLVRNRYGLTIKTLTMPTGYDVTADEIVEQFEAAITPRTKVLAFAGITLFTGTMMPMRRLCELAQRHGLTTVIDGALLPGLVNLDMRALGADFIACSGSKFQCGPLGTGILYLRNKVFPEYNPLPLPTFWPVISTWYPMIGSPPPRTRTSVESDDTALYVQSAGSASIARGAALARACEIWDEIGRDRIERRAMELGDHARQRLVEAFGKESIFSPGEDPLLKSPLIAFNPFRDPEAAWNIKKFTAFTDRLEREHRIWIRWTEFDVPGSPHQHYAARVCTHLFNTREEIDRAIGIMARIGEEMS